jgi:hypothetical protein
VRKGHFFYYSPGSFHGLEEFMRKGLFAIIIVIGVCTLVSCSQDPVPTAITGNPRIDFVRDSVVMLGQAGEQPLISSIAVTPDGHFYAAGTELRTDASYVQGNLWKLDGDIWRSALDPATRDLLLSARGVAASPSGAVWVVGSRKQAAATGYSIVLRGFDDNWVDMSPQDAFEAQNVTIAGEDDIWVYGQFRELLHYRNGSWEFTSLPEPWASMEDLDLRVQSVAADANNAWALLSVYGALNTEGRVLLQLRGSEWVPLYYEGAIDSAGTVNRSLRSLFLHQDGSLRAAGDAVYIWAGEKFSQVFRPRDGGKLLCASTTASGQMMAAGEAGSACWSDGLSWFNVHLAYDERLHIWSLAFLDTVAVMTGLTSDSTSSVTPLLRGPISRISPR